MGLIRFIEDLTPKENRLLLSEWRRFRNLYVEINDYFQAHLLVTEPQADEDLERNQA